MNQEFQEQPVEDEVRAVSLGEEPDLSQTADIGDPAQTVPTVAPVETNPSQPEPTRPPELTGEQLTQFAVQHIQSLGGEVQLPEAPGPRAPEPQNPVEGVLAARQFDQLAQSIATEVATEAGVEGAEHEVYEFIAKLGPDAVTAYQTNPLFQDMVDTKIDAIVGSHTQGLEERDRLSLPSSEEVGGSTNKELRSGLSGHRQAFERAGLDEHMSFDDFIRDLEI